jgi:hypothetical protein
LIGAKKHRTLELYANEASLRQSEYDKNIQDVEKNDKLYQD